MSAPKSVIKVKKDKETNGTYVEYTSNVEATEYYIHELTRAALRDVGKYIKKAWQVAFYDHFKRHSGKANKSIKYNVWANAKTIYPRVQIGLTGKIGFYSFFNEFGSTTVPKLGLLRNTTYDNIAEIVRIESQYLSGLSDEADRLESLIDEEEYTDESDE